MIISLLTVFQTSQAQSAFDLAEKEALHWAAQNRLKTGSLSLLKLKEHPTVDSPYTLYLAEYAPTGFLIFFLQDSLPDIIGYSTENELPTESDHPLFTEWLPNAQPSAEPAYPVIREERLKGSKSMQDLVVEPLVAAKWGQGIPWNKYCPADDQDHHALVGCVAVAMGQVMRKWNWPARGLGSNTYTPTNYPAYGELHADFDTLYPWQSMDYVQPTDASAYLLYHAGVATFMNYGPNESGANTSVYAPMALKDNFRYYKGMQVREKERYLEKDWFRILRQELINGRPLIYFGSNPDGGTGHAFNIDGFHSEQYFHFNWGWNGAGNGYYRLENMAEGGGNFTKGQAAIFWIQPDNIPLHDRPGFVQTLPGDGYVKLLWDDLIINDFSHYNIYRDGVLIGNSIDNQYLDEGLENGHTYTYQISASYIGNEEGESSLTEELASTPVAALTLPNQTTFETRPDNWEFSNDARGFQWGKASDLGFSGNDGHVMAIRSDLAGSGTQVMDYLTAPSLDIRGINHVAISFDYVFKQQPGVDYLFLMYRRYDNGLWYPIAKLNATGDWGDWKTVYYYFPPEAKYHPIQLGFYYNDFRGVGFGAAVDNIRIWTIAEPPKPEFEISTDTICRFESVTVYPQSTGEIYDWQWDFGDGAEPRYATTPGPHTVSYLTPGNKTISLLLNHLDPIVKANLLWVNPDPVSGFEVDISGLLAEFIDTSKNATFYFWDFGNGKTSTEQNPSCKYTEFEKYTVTQVVWNEHCDPDTTKVVLDFRINSGIDQFDISDQIQVFPNPASDFIQVAISHPGTNFGRFIIFDLTGKEVFRQESSPQAINQLNVQSLKPGVYVLLVDINHHIGRKKILIE